MLTFREFPIDSSFEVPVIQLKYRFLIDDAYLIRADSEYVEIKTMIYKMIDNVEMM